MALPVPANVTVDVYRSTNPPPAGPVAVAGVKGYLAPYGRSSLTSPFVTHTLLVDATTDIRDHYVGGQFTGVGTTEDRVTLAGKIDMVWEVVLVRTKGVGTAIQCKEVLLKRLSITWPQTVV